MPTTPNWALRYPASTDNNDVPLHMSQLAADADAMAQFAKGTFASRPTAVDAKSGKYYFATDTAVLYLSDGAVWIEVAPGNGSAPIGAMLDYAGSGDPDDTRYLLADGRAISRTTYAALFALTSTTYGVGDGSTTFNIPDLRGRVTAGPDNMGTAQGAAARLTANNARGNSAGTENHTHGGGSLAALDHLHSPGSLYTGSHSHSGATTSSGSNAFTVGGGGTIYRSVDHTHGIYADGNLGVYGATGAADRALTLTGASTSVGTTQPYQVANKIIRVS